LGFYFESAFKQGQYSEAACVLWVFFGLIASIRYWLKWPLIPFYSVTAWFWLPDSPPVYGSYFWQFISHDIWPAPLLEGKLFAAAQWYGTQLFELLIPAAGYTLVLSLLALVLTGLLALILFPLASKPIVGRANIAGYGLLLLLRSTPEIVIAFILLLVFGPSGLPAILALAIHNSGLIGYIIARQSEQLPLRADHPKNVNLYSFEIVPRIFPQLLTLLLYRWEVIMRESAILGLLGVTTLGFYIDSAFEEIRYDKAFLLVIVAALMNIGVDMAARRIRTSAGISNANLSASTQTATPKAT
jgi:ABC-type phosphate/phosphonate transport system, permease component